MGRLYCLRGNHFLCRPVTGAAEIHSHVKGKMNGCAAAALDMPCSFCYYANMACKPIFAFHAIYHFAFLYRILDFTHNLKKNRVFSAFIYRISPAVHCYYKLHLYPKTHTNLHLQFLCILGLNSNTSASPTYSSFALLSL